MAIPPPLPNEDLAAVERLRESGRKILSQCNQRIVGQADVLEQLLICMFARGHCLLMGVPGLAKTLMIRTLAEATELSYNRIQFTPDLMPSDATGTEILQDDPETGRRIFRFVKGPLFANVVLADEINRTPPKTQAALLEAMQEKQVTVSGVRHKLPEPFFVLATQNPIEQEGTYPLPEAQLDRFLFLVHVNYPSEQEEYDIVEATTRKDTTQIVPMVSAEDLLLAQNMVLQVPVAPHVIRYAIRLARSTRISEGGCPEFVQKYVRWGAGPRASQALILAAKSRAVLRGETFAGVEDVKAIAAPVLRHRILTNFNAESDGITTDEIIKKLLEHTRERD